VRLSCWQPLLERFSHMSGEDFSWYATTSSKLAVRMVATVAALLTAAHGAMEYALV
jgi:hypothetical protein